eukprot:3857056-Ditylum_brightwellii.AAC.1
MPPDIPIDAIALGSWKLYMSELAISLENKVLKKFEEHNVISKGTTKSKLSTIFFVKIMKRLIDAKKISHKQLHEMKEGYSLF